jgi:organic hydroperoxide reductase OsmC/OhrA
MPQLATPDNAASPCARPAGAREIQGAQRDFPTLAGMVRTRCDIRRIGALGPPRRVFGARRGRYPTVGSFRAGTSGMLVPFPHRYSATLSRTLASRARIEAPCLVLPGGPTPELDAWSPEHMLLSSLGLCMLTTFETFAARDAIDVVSWRTQVSGTVEQTPEGPMFTSIVLELDIEIAGNVDQFEATLEDAKQYCLVQNALRVPVVVEIQLRTPYGDQDDDDDDVRDIAELMRRPQSRPQPVRRQLHAI